MMRRKRIAALMAGVDKEYQQAFTWGMVRAARSQDVDLCIFNCMGFADGFERNDRGERAIFELPDLSGFDGVVLLQATIPTEACRRQICELIAAHPDIPLVTIDEQVDHSVEITFDDLSNVRELMKHLLEEHNLRVFAVVTGPVESPVAMARYEVCRQMIAEYGAHLDPESVIDGRWVREGGRQAVDLLLERKQVLPDVIVCGNDDMAFGVIERLRECGYSVPGRVKVTGFDARREAVGRGLTTIRRPVRNAGELAVNTLINWIANGRPEETCQLLPTQPVYGESCGCVLDGNRASSYVRLLSDERRHAEQSLLQAAAFFGSLAGVSGEKEAGERITAFAENWGAQEMYVCVDPAFINSAVHGRVSAYPQEMLQLSGWGCGTAALQRRFPTNQLLPRLDEERDHPLALVFSPLYYTDKNLGYAVFDVDHATGYALYSLLTLLSGALMSLSLRSTVRAYAAALENMSIHDVLTGLYNRRGYEQVVPPVFDKARAGNNCFAVISCDMDGMKHINDCHGHLSGDKAICRMGKALTALEQEGMTCVHISGDEFLALGIVSDESDADRLVRKLQESIDRVNREDPWICDIAASIGGYAAVPVPGDHLDDFLTQADRRMYANKKNRRSD